MPRRPKPIPNVRRRGDNYCAVVSIEGRCHYGKPRLTAERAGQDAEEMRAGAVPEKLATLQDGLGLVRAELRASDASPATADFYRNHFTALKKRWHAHTLLASSTVTTKDVQMLDRIMRIAVKRQWVPANPLDHVLLTKVRTKRFDWLPANTVRAGCRPGK